MKEKVTEEPASPADVSFTRAGFWRGFVMAQPLAPGVGIYAVVFGMLASERGRSLLESLLMSIFVYSGTAQLAVLQSWTTDALVLPLVATVLVMNARYVLYGAAIQPWLARVTRTQALGSLFFMGDGNWVLAMREYHAGYRDAGFVFGSGVATFAPWLVGTVVGYVLGSTVPDPATLGLDFMLVAFAAAIGVAMWKSKADLWPVCAAALVAWVLHRTVPGGWYIVGAGLAGGLMGALRHGR